MIPLHDDNPTQRKPDGTVAISVLCSLGFLWEEARRGARGEAAPAPPLRQQALYAF